MNKKIITEKDITKRGEKKFKTENEEKIRQQKIEKKEEIISFLRKHLSMFLTVAVGARIVDVFTNFNLRKTDLHKRRGKLLINVSQISCNTFTQTTKLQASGSLKQKLAQISRNNEQTISKSISFLQSSVPPQLPTSYRSVFQPGIPQKPASQMAAIGEIGQLYTHLVMREKCRGRL